MNPSTVLLSIGILLLDGTALRLSAQRRKRSSTSEQQQYENNAANAAALTQKGRQEITSEKHRYEGISRRAGKNLDWFQRKHAGHMARIEAKQPQIDLMTAENWLMRQELTNLYKQYINEHLSAKALSYADGLGGDPDLLKTSAAFFNRLFAPAAPVLPEHIVAGAGCSAILDNLLYDICDPGDGVLVETPFWGGFETSFVLRSQAVAVHVQPTDGASGVDSFIGAYQKALDSSSRPVKAILFCNPHNPRGDLYPRERIEALLKFCHRNSLHFVSDEIYGLSTFDSEVSFTSVLQLDLQALGVNPALVHFIYSISKDLGSSGLRLGYLVTQAHPELRRSLAISNHSKVSSLTSIAVNALLSDVKVLDDILSQNRTRLAQSASFVTGFLAHHGFEYVRPAAGVFIWARLGGASCTWEAEKELSRKLQVEGVSVGAGSSYCAAQPGWFRITFAVPAESMARAVRLVEAALDLADPWQPASP